MDEIILLSDPRLLNIEENDTGEPWVNLLDSVGLLVDKTSSQIASRSNFFACLRKSIKEKLIVAQNLLPIGLRLYIKEAFRPISIQKIIYNRYASKISTEHPSWDPNRIHKEVSTYVAPPAIAPHSTGGAIDLTIIANDGLEIDMGTPFNANPSDTNNATYFSAINITSEARYSRDILKNIMETAGFVNYPTEWWHWSYGDRYWAIINRKTQTLYKVTEAPWF